jgi:hypothetical protein
MIRTSSKNLNEKLESLRGSGSKILPETVMKNVTTSIDYIQAFDKTVSEANDINQVNAQVS